MPLRSARDLFAEAPNPPAPAKQTTFVAPETDFALTLDRLAALIRAHPEMATRTLCYEVERVALGDGLVLITSECFQPTASISGDERNDDQDDG